MSPKLPQMVEIEFLGIVKSDGKRIEHFTELGQRHGIGEKLRVPKYRAASLIKTYPEGFRYTSDADASRESGGGGSGGEGESESGSEDPDPETSQPQTEPMKQKKPKKRKRRVPFFGRKSKKPKTDKSMKGRQNKSL